MEVQEDSSKIHWTEDSTSNQRSKAKSEGEVMSRLLSFQEKVQKNGLEGISFLKAQALVTIERDWELISDFGRIMTSLKKFKKGKEKAHQQENEEEKEWSNDYGSMHTERPNTEEAYGGKKSEESRNWAQESEARPKQQATTERARKGKTIMMELYGGNFLREGPTSKLTENQKEEQPKIDQQKERNEIEQKSLDWKLNNPNWKCGDR
ncbi:hypothetical protein PIB30_059003 [Stylosanthes scabra]|uniref:Uncharacterized protein n=1 Tax=Stylosanthes scabra TaxID=79078 RepID=A0ABU6XLC7_9FABA|nr:hypothetical protein [Stylosanthes scabra]